MKKLGETIKPTQLKAYFKSRGEYDMNMASCTRLISYLTQGNISQLIFDFEIDRLQKLVDYLEDLQEYEVLAIIRDKVEKHNTLTNNNYNMKA
jgi:hypothetical protein